MLQNFRYIFQESGYLSGVEKAVRNEKQKEEHVGFCM